MSKPNNNKSDELKNLLESYETDGMNENWLLILPSASPSPSLSLSTSVRFRFSFFLLSLLYFGARFMIIFKSRSVFVLKSAEYFCEEEVKEANRELHGLFECLNG